MKTRSLARAALLRCGLLRRLAARLSSRGGAIDPRVTIGRHSYGFTAQTFQLWGGEERIEVGSFCSFGPEVLVFGGGEHGEGRVSTFPLRTLLFERGLEDLDATSKGPTRIGNDCWLGRRAMVLSGVTVGDGAIIGAGAVVARDVPPYAVVAGNPARLLRHRFEPEIIERLGRVRWWDLDDERLAGLGPLFYGDVEDFLRALER